MTTAFVLSGGGSLGAVQVGMLKALREIRRQDVFPLDPLRQVRALRGAQASLCSNESFRRMLAAQTPVRRLEEATIPVHLVAADVLSGEEVLLSSGNAVDAVLASAAIPAVLPPVEVEGRLLWDGGVANNAAISHALDLGADRVFVLPAGVSCALDQAPKGVLASALHALSLLIEQRLIVEVAYLAGRADLHVLPPLCPLSVASFDFRHGAELIDRGRRATRTWFSEGGTKPRPPDQCLSLHRHVGAAQGPEPH